MLSILGKHLPVLRLRRFDDHKRFSQAAQQPDAGVGLAGARDAADKDMFFEERLRDLVHRIRGGAVLEQNPAQGNKSREIGRAHV